MWAIEREELEFNLFPSPSWGSECNRFILTRGGRSWSRAMLEEGERSLGTLPGTVSPWGSTDGGGSTAVTEPI
jgi:hypothetical protein